jgi:hypothetical protein
MLDEYVEVPEAAGKIVKNLKLSSYIEAIQVVPNC